MLRDRGINKKWQGFFMPEHIKTLRDNDRDYYKTDRPQLDETQIDDMERLLLESLSTKTLLDITTWKDGFFHSKVGIVNKIDSLNKNIQVLDELDCLITINFFTITNVHHLNNHF